MVDQLQLFPLFHLLLLSPYCLFRTLFILLLPQSVLVVGQRFCPKNNQAGEEAIAVPPVSMNLLANSSPYSADHSEFEGPSLVANEHYSLDGGHLEVLVESDPFNVSLTTGDRLRPWASRQLINEKIDYVLMYTGSRILLVLVDLAALFDFGVEYFYPLQVLITHGAIE